MSRKRSKMTMGGTRAPSKEAPREDKPVQEAPADIADHKKFACISCGGPTVVDTTKPTEKFPSRHPSGRIESIIYRFRKCTSATCGRRFRTDETVASQA